MKNKEVKNEKSILEELRTIKDKISKELKGKTPLADSLHNKLNYWRKFVTCAKLTFVIKNPTDRKVHAVALHIVK